MEGLVIAGIAIIAILSVLGIIRSNLKICQPNEVLIFSGKKRQLPDGKTLG